MRYLLITLLAIFSVAASPAYQEDYSNQLNIGNHTFATEIADTPKKMQRGMMFRPSMTEKQAMIFIYPRAQKASFWMKNTLISLDILFFDEQGELLEIKHSVPPCKSDYCPTYSSRTKNIRYVVELKGGISEKLAIQIGDKLNGENQ